MKKTKVMAAFLTMVLAGSVFMGGAGNVVKAAEGAEDKEPVTLRFSWWGGDERNEATLQVIDNFEKEYPWITIEPEFGGDQG